MYTSTLEKEDVAHTQAVLPGYQSKQTMVKKNYKKVSCNYAKWLLFSQPDCFVNLHSEKNQVTSSDLFSNTIISANSFVQARAGCTSDQIIDVQNLCHYSNNLLFCRSGETRQF